MNTLLLLSNGGNGADNFVVEGAGVVARIPFGHFGIEYLYLTESVMVQWLVIILLGTLFFVLGRNLKVNPTNRRQVIAETIVTTFDNMVNDSMGLKYFRYQPYIAALFFFSMGLSFTAFLGLFPPTADISVIGGWGIMTFVLVQFTRFKTGGLLRGLRSYVVPTPLNIVSEVANPLSLTFRHYGNILAGLIIGGLIFWALRQAIVLPLIIPMIPALYFDMFLGLLQAFVFTTLSMVYISGADCSPDADA
ncbi:MAG: F0F1 ATP synthase subunit A [Oscillospiraceae bacterium]|nr:F0F1 ATP synthase subunit A [Oscillospiraceae bacterium]